MTQIQSIRSILALDFKVLFCSHKPQLNNGKQLLKEKLLFLESFFENVSRLFEKGYSINEIFQSLKLREYWMIRLLSGGNLSKLNMVKSVIRDLEMRNS